MHARYDSRKKQGEWHLGANLVLLRALHAEVLIDWKATFEGWYRAMEFDCGESLVALRLPSNDHIHVEHLWNHDSARLNAGWMNSLSV